MKYMVIVDEEAVLDKDGNPHINLNVYDPEQYIDAVAVPIFKPIMVSDNGGFVYMDQEHIDVLIDYEIKENLKSIVNRMEQTLLTSDEEWKKYIKTPVPFEPVNPKAVCFIKCCDTCKYKDKLITQEPCFSCETKRGCYEKWEAKEND